MHNLLSGFLQPKVTGVQSITPTFSKVTIEPMERGYGHTLGNRSEERLWPHSW